MNVLGDTSLWVDHFRYGNDGLVGREILEPVFIEKYKEVMLIQRGLINPVIFPRSRFWGDARIFLCNIQLSKEILG